jgi:hypothetical protein
MPSKAQRPKGQATCPAQQALSLPKLSRVTLGRIPSSLRSWPIQRFQRFSNYVHGKDEETKSIFVNFMAISVMSCHRVSPTNLATLLLRMNALRGPFLASVNRSMDSVPVSACKKCCHQEKNPRPEDGNHWQAEYLKKLFI